MKTAAIQAIIILLRLTAGYGQDLNLQFKPIPASFNVNTPNPVYAVDINYDNTDLIRQALDTD